LEQTAKRVVKAMIATSETGSRCAKVRGGNPSEGFSLIELLVVLTLMVILSSLFPVALEHMIPARRLAAVSQQLASTLRDLQSVALATGQNTSLFPDGPHYVVRDGSGAEKVVELPAHMTLRLQDDASGRALTNLTFFSDGSSTGGRFEFQYEDKRRSVVVTRLMGRVHDEG
jgi:type II secretion system protein H